MANQYMRTKLLSFFVFVALFVLIGSFNCFAMGSSHKMKMVDALVLLIDKDYQVSRSGNYTLTLHVKTLIKTYRGKKSWADFRTTYNSNFEQIKVIRAITVRPDGKKIVVTPKEIHDLTDPSTQRAAIFSNERLKVINFPSVEEGCTVELVLEKRSRLGLWAVEPFALRDPVMQKRVTVSVPKDVELEYHLGSKKIAFAKESKGDKVTYKWIGRNLERIIPDPMMPPMENRPDTLIFSTLRSWNEVGSLFEGFLNRKHHANAVAPLSKNTPIQTPKDAKDIYLFVKKRIEVFPIPFFFSTMSFSSPEETIARGYGSQMDAVLLFKNLLEQKGIESKIVAANSRGILLKGLKDCHAPLFFDTFLIKAQELFFSFDMKESPPGITGLDGQLGLDIESGKFVTIKDIVKKDSIQDFKFTISSPSSFEADYKGKFLGMAAISMKNSFKDLTPAEFLVRSSIFYHSLHPLSEPLSPLHVTGLDQSSHEVNISAKYKVNNFDVKTDKLHLFPSKSSGILGALSRLLPERSNDLFIKRPQKESIRITIRLPASLTFFNIPPNMSGQIGPVSWENHCDLHDNTLSCTKSFWTRRGFVRLGKQFQELYEAVQNLMDPRINSYPFIQSVWHSM